MIAFMVHLLCAQLRGRMGSHWHRFQKQQRGRSLGISGLAAIERADALWELPQRRRAGPRQCQVQGDGGRGRPAVLRAWPVTVAL